MKRKASVDAHRGRQTRDIEDSQKVRVLGGSGAVVYERDGATSAAFACCVRIEGAIEDGGCDKKY